jgi:hypothetical protein
MRSRATSRTASRTGSRTLSLERTNNQPSPNTNSGSAGSGLLTQVGSSYRFLTEEDSRSHADHPQVDQMLLATLTCRDVAILLALDQYRYLDRHQLEQLFFQGPRSAQLRLRYLSVSGLVLCWRMRRKPGRVLRPWIFLLSSRGARLLAEVSGTTSSPFVKRAEHAQTAAFHVVHDIEANAFFVDVATASSVILEQGLYHWVGERGCWRAYAEAHELGPIPDGWGRYLLPEGEVIFFLEWDRATLRRSRIRSKVSQYRTYFRGRQRAATTNVLFVVPSISREAQIREEILAVIRDTANESCRFWTTTTERLQGVGPLGPIWRSSGSHVGLKRLADLPKQPRSSYSLEGCIGKPAWWERRPAGGQGA